MKFVVLSSSKGTVFQSVIDRLVDGSLTATCLGLISDKEERGSVAKARAAKLPVVIMEKKKEESREEFDQRISQQVRNLGGDDATVIACMGWMWLLSPWFVQHHQNKILNVHPSLLPKYPGTHAHDDVLAAKETESGMTIHLIDEGLDTGKILVQKKCSVDAGETVESLKKKVQALESEWYPKVLQMIETGELQLP